MTHMTKRAALRRLLRSERVSRVVGAHDALSAKLAERHGFDAIWASSFGISASAAVPDASILSMTELLAAVVSMNDASPLPLIADCDSGFGQVRNVVHLVRRYEGSGISAICIEDKVFPKVNSFAARSQVLVSTEDFCAKILAAVGTRQDPEFAVIGRTEALIAGLGLDEALRRAHAYVAAGADAILVQSSDRTGAEVTEFARRWALRAPLAVVPTAFPEMQLNELAESGVRLVIYANHALRAAVRAMDTVLSEIAMSDSSACVEDRLGSMKEVFALQHLEEMQDMETRYHGLGRAVASRSDVDAVPAPADREDAPSCSR